MNPSPYALGAFHSRRQFFSRCGIGMGSMALSTLLGHDGVQLRAAEEPGRDGASSNARKHFPARAKSVIFLFMGGGPSHLDMLEYKPYLEKFNDTPIPLRFVDGAKLAQKGKKQPKVLASRWKFARHGECGAYVSELLPYTAGMVDDLTLLKTVKTDNFVHPQAELQMFNGVNFFGYPSMGAWVTYGLGSQSRDLPGFVVLETSGRARSKGAIHASGFLPSAYQGVPLRSGGEPILNLNNPKGVRRENQEDVVGAVNALNASRYERTGDEEIRARVAAYEMALRMQMSAPELVDIRGENQDTLKLYGVDPNDGGPSFAKNCLLARRLVERGVRFVQVSHPGWDHHGDLFPSLPKKCREIDQGCYALVQDLKRRGLLHETLVIWGGEFGRTPVIEKPPSMSGGIGRDHHLHAFLMWMAGGGTNAGHTVGKTDDFAFRATEDSMHVNDLQATILHILGLDHLKLTYRFQGRDFRLTDVGGKVMKKVLA